MKKHLLFYLLVIVAMPVIGFSQNYYNVTYNIGFHDHPTAFASDLNGNIVVCGWYNEADETTTHAFALKVDANGQEVWRKTVQDASKYYAVCITSTGNVALAGSKNDHCFLKMLDAQSGTETWSYLEDKDAGYWFGTVNEFSIESEYRLQAFKVTDETYPILFYIFNSATGAYIDKDLNINNAYEPIHTSGNVSDSTIWSGADDGLIVMSNYNGMGGLWTFSANYIAGVEKYSETQGCVVNLSGWDPNYAFQILTMDFSSGEVYGKFFDITNANAVAGGSGIIGDKKIMVTGTIDGELALWLIKHDLSEMETKIIHTDNNRTGVDVLGLPSRDMVIMGSEAENRGSSTDVFLMKLNSAGIASTPEHNTANNFTIYPNPASEKVFIKNIGGHKVKVVLTDAFGKIVKTISDVQGSVSINNIPSGLYIVAVYLDGKYAGQQKLVKL